MPRISTLWLACIAVLALGCGGIAKPESVERGQAPLVAQQQKLQVTDLAPNDQLGTAVAVLGDRAVLGAPSDDDGPNSEAGSVSVFTRSGSIWTLQQKLNAPEAACSRFGAAVALAADYLFVGCPAPSGTAGRAAVYIFVWTGSAWSAVQRIDAFVPSEPFGYRLSVSGSTLVVGGDAIRVYVPDGALWVLEQAIPAPPASFVVSGDTLVRGYGGEGVGANTEQGAAHVYQRSGSVWVETQTLAASDGEPYDHFGNDMALDGDTLLIADRDDFIDGQRAGSVYVFGLSGGAWLERQKLTASDEAAGDGFGVSVALAGDRAVVGAAFHEHFGQNANHGSAYVFLHSGGTWSEHDELLAVDRQNNDFFGAVLALSGHTVIIGAPNDDDVYQATGSGYAFTILAELGESCTGSADCVSGLLCKSGRCCDGSCDVGADSPCSSDADCPANLYCGSLARCQVQKTEGRACEPFAAQDCMTDGCRVCATGACVDGFCCNEVCDGGTEACAQALTGAPNGTCAAVVACTDPAGGTGGSGSGGSGGTGNGGETGGATSGGTSATGGSSAGGSGGATGGTGGSDDACAGPNPPDWVLRQTLVPSDGGPDDTGHMAISASGDTIAMGLLWDDDEMPVPHPGAVYMFQRSGGEYVEVQRLVAPDSVPLDSFGFSVALDGDTLLVGAQHGGGGAGAVYVFTRSASVWAFQQKLPAPTGIGENAVFGYSVSLRGDTAVATTADPVRNYVFVRSGSGWSHQQTLEHSGTGTFQTTSIDLSEDGNRLLAGLRCPGIGLICHCPEVAATFVRTGSVWNEGPTLSTGGGYFLGDGTKTVALMGDEAFAVTELGRLPVGVIQRFRLNGTEWEERTPINRQSWTLVTASYGLAAWGHRLLAADLDGQRVYSIVNPNGDWNVNQTLSYTASDLLGLGPVALADDVAAIGVNRGENFLGIRASLAIYGHCD